MTPMFHLFLKIFADSCGGLENIQKLSFRNIRFRLPENFQYQKSVKTDIIPRKTKVALAWRKDSTYLIFVNNGKVGSIVEILPRRDENVSL